MGRSGREEWWGGVVGRGRRVGRSGGERKGCEMRILSDSPSRLHIPIPVVKDIHYSSSHLQHTTSGSIRSHTYDGAHRPTTALSFGSPGG